MEKYATRQNFRLILLFFITVLGVVVVGCSHPFPQGQSLYEANCSRCHGMDGNGFENLYPGILESSYLTQRGPGLACVIVYGSTYLSDNRDYTAQDMPQNNQLSPVEVLNIINYLSWEFGNGEQETIDMVMRALEDCVE